MNGDVTVTNVNPPQNRLGHFLLVVLCGAMLITSYFIVYEGHVFEAKITKNQFKVGMFVPDEPEAKPKQPKPQKLPDFEHLEDLMRRSENQIEKANKLMERAERLLDKLEQQKKQKMNPAADDH